MERKLNLVTEERPASKIYRVSWKMSGDIAEECPGSVFRSEKSEDGGSTFVRNVGKHQPD